MNKFGPLSSEQAKSLTINTSDDELIHIKDEQNIIKEVVAEEEEDAPSLSKEHCDGGENELLDNNSVLGHTKNNQNYEIISPRLNNIGLYN